MFTDDQSISFNDDQSIINIDDYAFTIDSNGNAVDSEGTIMATADTIEEYRNRIIDTPPADDSTGDVDDEPMTEIDIEGVTHQLDDAGNAIDENGVIVMTADEIEQELAKDDIQGLGDIIKTTGIPIFDEDGSPLEYEDTVEGLQAYIQDVNEVSRQEGRESAINELLTELPILEDVINHLRSGGSLDTLDNTIDYSAIAITKDDVDAIKDVIIHGRLLKGDTMDEAEAMYDFINKKGTAFETATKVHKELVINQTEQRNEQRTLIAQQEQEEAEQEQAYVKAVSDIIDNGTITIGTESLVIPSKFSIKENGNVSIYSREEFKTYFTEPLEVRFKDGSINYMTGYQYDKMLEDNKRTVDHDVYDALRLFTNNDLSQVINKQVDSRKVKDIKSLINRNRDGSMVSRPDKNPGNTQITYRLGNE